MSELINTNDNRATIRWKLLTTASAMALTAYISSTGLARADDSDHPQLWIELGGQMEQMSGLFTPFTAPFMFVTPTPEPYQGISINGMQRPPRFAFGAEGKITFQPEDSNWLFSIGIRYGRSHAKRHVHHQTAGVPLVYYSFYYHHATKTFLASNPQAFIDAKVPSSEHHLLVDFSVGKDVGIGLLGRDGTSNVNAGVRLLDLTEAMSGTIYARPSVGVKHPGPKYIFPYASFDEYTLKAHANRSFRGVGPSLSWNASAAIAGNAQDGEIMIDWGINAGLLFGKQKAKTDHSTTATHYSSRNYQGPIYPSRSRNNPLRSRSVTVPNIGGFAGLSLKWPNAKVSIGYRYDTFLKAMDIGIDARKTSNLTFNGPYASISIGLGD